MRLLFYTVRGLEEALRLELEELGARAVEALPSRVLAEADAAVRPRTASRVAELLGEAEARPLRRSLRLAIRAALPRGAPCRVRGYVHGRCIPARVLELVAAREAKRRGCGGGLLLVDYFCGSGRILLAREVEALWAGRRGYYRGGHPATLNPLLAAAIPFLAGVRGGVVLDPLCGSGTIPVEASLARGLRGLCSDVEPGYVAIAARSAAASGADVEVFAADVLAHPVRGAVDLVATDPPRASLGVHLRLAAAAVRLGRLAAVVTPYPGRVAALLEDARVYATFQGGERVAIVVGRPRGA